MTRIIFVEPGGDSIRIEAPAGSTVMREALTRGLDGILAECGGNLSCGTCHVYVRSPEASRLPPMSPEEAAMLEMTASERRPNSRLACQLLLEDELEELVIDLPETQL